MYEKRHKQVGLVRATLRGIGDTFRRGSVIGNLTDEDRIEGRTCLVTGANSGLGKGIAIELALRGGRIVMVGRTMDEKSRREIMKKGKTEKVEMYHCDLADLGSISDFAGQIAAAGLKIDILVCNAGIVNLAPRQTVYGVSEMFLVNYLANVMLISKLLDNDCIPLGAKPASRIIFVSSEAHRWVGDLDLDHLGRFKSGTIKDVMPLYSEDKHLLMAFGQELSRRLSENGESTALVFSHCPGAVRSNIARQAPGWSQPFIKGVFYIFFRSPRKAARPAVYQCCSRSLEGQTGLYLHIMKPKEVDPRAADPGFGHELYHKSVQLLDRLLK